METKTDVNQFNIKNDRESGTYYSLQKMNQLHHEIVRRIVSGQKDHEIAKALDISTATVKYTKESPIVQQKLDIMMGARDASAIEVREQIRHLAPLALHYLSEMMGDKQVKDNVRKDINQDLLDRAGFGAISWKGDVTKVDQDRIDDIKQRARENGIIAEAEEAEVVEEEEESAEG